MLGLTAVSLSGCGWGWPDWMTLDSDPFFFMGDNDTDENDTPAPPLVIPKDEPDQNAPQAAIMPSTTLGLNLDTYFAQEIEDPQTRMQRIENVVVAMHKDMQNIRPDLAPAKPMPADTMQQQGQMAYQQPGQPTMLIPGTAPPQQAPQPSPGAPPGTSVYRSALAPAPQAAPQQGYPPSAMAAPTQAPAQQGYVPSPQVAQNYAPPASGQNVQPGSWLADKPATGQALATGIRVGEHADRVRVVFDVTKTTTFRADLDNSENLLVVELPEASWQAPPAAKFPKMALFDSYRVDPFNGNAGSIAVIQLKRGTRILKQMQIDALSGGGKRIYIDLAK